MADLGSHLPVQFEPVKDTTAMVLKWIQVEKQQHISQIVKLKQAMEDLRLGEMAKLEYALMKAEAELDGIKKKEQLILTSIESTTVEQ